MAELNTTKLNRIMKKLGGDEITARNNLESTFLDEIDKLADNAGGGSDISSYISKCSSLFSGNTKITEVKNFDASATTSLEYMFNNCTALKSVSLINAHNVTTTRFMFNGCKNLETASVLNTGKVSNFSNMFYGCTNLKTVSDIDASSATSLECMFQSCSSLKKINVLNTSKNTSLYYFCLGCNALEDVPLLDTSNVESVRYAFRNCPNLTNESLNNIMLMCANSKITNYSSKYLSEAGLTPEQCEVCKTLSNYSALVSAGWAAQ